MKDTLRDRIEAFSKSLDSKHFLDKVRLIQEFIETELKARDVPYSLTTQDLSLIHSNAVQESINSSLNTNDSNELALWWTKGVLNWLRSKDMLYFIIGGQKGMTNDSKTNDSK